LCRLGLERRDERVLSVHHHVVHPPPFCFSPTVKFIDASVETLTISVAVHEGAGEAIPYAVEGEQ